MRASQQDDGAFVLSISDDGRGIDWDKLAQKAAAAGLATNTRADLERALYADAISTRDQVSETSGRGVGLGAVWGAVTGLGGRMEVESTAGQGTTFRIVLPWPASTESLAKSSLLEAAGHPARRSSAQSAVRMGPARGA